MSESIEPQKSNQKAKGLGRGLGSLLGSSNNGAFGKTSSLNEDTLEKLRRPEPPKSAQQKPSAPPVVVKPPQPVLEKPVPVAVKPEASAVPPHMRIWKIGIEKIEPNPDQPRRVFKKEHLEELAQSIREKGVIQPILIRKTETEKFQIIAGERRWRAAQIAGLLDVPAILKDAEEQEVLELALIENIQRQDLNAIEEAEAYDFLIEKYNLTQQDLAKKVGKDRATIANLLRLLQLQPSVREMVSVGELSLGQAKVLLSVSDIKDQHLLAKRAIADTMSVRALERLVAKAREPNAKVESIDEQLRKSLAENLGEELQKLIGSRVNLDYSGGKGKISIHFYSDQELNQLAEKLRDSWRQK